MTERYDAETTVDAPCKHLTQLRHVTPSANGCEDSCASEPRGCTCVPAFRVATSDAATAPGNETPPRSGTPIATIR